MQASRKGGPIPEPPAPTPLRGRPEPPEGLDVEAAQHWEDTVSMIDGAGMLSLLDRDAMIIYINLWMNYRKARSMVNRPKEEGGGTVVNTKNGPKKSAWYVVMAESARDMKTYLDRFGLTPLGRSRLKMAPKDEDDGNKWAGFDVVGAD